MSALDFLSGQVLRSTAGAIYTGAKAYYWSDAGASIPLTVYTDAGLSSAHPNPVVADGTTGAFPAIFIQARRYWRTVTDSGGVALTQFNIGPIDHPTLFASAAAPSPTYPFLRYYNTTDGHVYRRNAANSAWIDEGLVDSLINAATVTDQLAGTETAKASTPDSVAGLWQRGSDITAASTLSLPATGGGTFNLTGTATTITAISSAAGGREVEIRLNAAHSFTHNGTSFILPGSANYTGASGDVLRFRNEAASDATGSNWRCTKITKASGSPVNITDFFGAQSDLETGTSNALIPTIGRMQYHPGVAKARCMYDQSSGTATVGTNSVSYNISSLTDGATGIATLNFTTSFASANYHPSGMANRGATNSDALVAGHHGTPATASALAIGTTTNAVATDFGYVGVTVHGDQA